MMPRSTEPMHDVVVVGAGPAGSITALSLASRGASVLLVDRARFPRPKVCGCCVNPRALESLRQAGLGRLLDRLGAIPLTGITLGRNGRQATIHHPLGMAVSRESFDAAIVNEAEGRGATFLPETSATLLPANSADFRELRLSRDGESWTVRGRFIVSATGLIDSIRDEPSGSRADPDSRIGAGAIAPSAPDGYPRGQIQMACGDDGYVGLVVLEDGRLDIAAALQPSAVRRSGGIGPLVERILAQSSFPEVPDVARLAWKGTPALSRTSTSRAIGRVFRVGDAAGYVEPFTGEGIAWALSGALRLADLLAGSAGTDPRAVERDWADLYRREITRTQLACRSARLAMRTPWIMAALVRILALQPKLAGPFIRSLHQPRRSRPGPFREGFNPS